MSMNKQTVWLVTMLTLMVVLSAYYIVTGPVEPVEQAGKPSKENDVQVDLKTEEADSKEEAHRATSDYFVGYQLQRNNLRSKMTEEYMNVLTDPESSEKELKEAQSKIDQLMKVDKTESVLEELIRNEGFRDAVVITGDQHVDVVVQSEKLSNSQVVKLIGLVKKHMDVPATQVSVAYRP
ncbi:MAG: SpoIIIAH-like family protein [Planifilum sp.]|jgi:stage III sporulation protein AH